MEEQEDKRRRVKIIILYNLPGSDEENDDGRMKEDIHWYRGLFENTVELSQYNVGLIIRPRKKKKKQDV